MTMRERMSEWWRPTLAVPTLGEPEAPVSSLSSGARGTGETVSYASGSPSRGLAHLFGHAHGIQTFVVSPQGIEIPVNNALGWTALELASVLLEIDSLPEIEPGSWRA